MTVLARLPLLGARAPPLFLPPAPALRPLTAREMDFCACTYAFAALPLCHYWMVSSERYFVGAAAYCTFSSNDADDA